ncbi:MAG: zinc-dependent metalloprotease, partial [Acidobacteriota bacterium]
SFLVFLLAGCASTAAAPRTEPGSTREGQPQQEEAAEERKSEDAQASEEGDDEKSYDEVITEEAVSDEGLFTVHRVEDEYYFEIPESLYGADMLLITRIAQVPEGISGFIVGGIKVAEQVLRWERRDDKILLRKVSFNQVADEEEPIHQSVVRNNFAPIVEAFDIEVEGPEGDTVVIDVTDFYSGDTPALSGLSSSQRREYEVRRLDGDRSFIDFIRSYPINVDVRHTLTYEANSPPANSRTGTISMQMHQSMVRLPEEPMMPRLADERVGYFDITQVNFGLDELEAAEQTFIRRWRLEPSDPEAYAAGELVDPVEPITYYIDPATPEKWRPYVKQGVEDWQEAFEAAGFSNAIVALDPPGPEEDPEWTPEDARYSVVRWAASMVRNAMGPSVSDPRTGEIIESDIVWYHNHLRSYRNRLMIETGASNPAARSLDIPEELMGETVRQVIAHEIGHAIGLPHNMIASSSYPTESLRDPDFARRMGVSPSVMDYARQNYVAQPGDGLEPTDYIRRIGPYDHHAVNWGYRVIPDASTPEAEKPTLDSWILERADDPMYRFGSSTGWNPDAQTEDMGNDPVASSTYAVANLQRVVPNLVEWTSTPGEGYDDLEEIYGELVFQWSRYVGHVVTLVGGRYENAKATDQEGPVYTPVPRAEQERAVQFIADQVFEAPTWLVDPEIQAVTEHAGALERIRSRQVSVLNQMLDPRRLQRVIEGQLFDPDAYSLREYLADLKAGVFPDLSGNADIDAYRRNLQRAHVERLEYLMTEEPEPLPDFFRAFLGDSVTEVKVSQSDIRPLARAQLREIRDEASAAADGAGDPVLQAHLEDMAARVEAILEGD